MATKDLSEVTAAGLVRHFAAYRDEANRRPVYITHHGRRTHVMLSFETYTGLGEQDGRKEAESDSEDKLFGLADWIDEGLVICGPDCEVQFANRVAQAITHHPARALVGRPLAQALPEIAGSLMEVHVRRTMTCCEPSAADIPSPFHADAWLRFQSFPLGDGIVLKFRDITEDVRRHRLADVKEAILEGMSVHGEIGYVRVSVRGTIDKVDPPFCDMLELPEDRLTGVAVSDLVDVASRPRFKASLEGVLRGEGSTCITTSFLSNAGGLVAVKLSIVQLQGAYGAEGAILLLTPETAA